MVTRLFICESVITLNSNARFFQLTNKRFVTMHYEGMIIRPPSEANSILLQVTVGCSHNKCTFCGTYAGERFKIKSDEIIAADIQFAKQYCQRQRRLFLCDGDALIIPQKRLVRILTAIKTHLLRNLRRGAV